MWAGGTDGAVRRTAAADAGHYAASTMKLPLLVAAYRRHERGEVDLDRPVPVHAEFASAAGTGSFVLRPEDDQDDETWAAVGGTVPLRELARRSVVRSGNLATDVLLEHVGLAEVTSVLAVAGCSARTRVERGIGDTPARDAGLDNVVTAHDLARILVGMAGGTLAGRDTCAAVEQVLAEQEDRGRIPAGLPPGTYVAHKTGWVDRVAHDVALVRPPDAPPYVLAVCTTAEPDRASPEEADRMIATVSTEVWEARR